MLSDRIVLIALAIWALLTGLFAVTNIRVDWGPTLAGFAALVLGIVCLLRAFAGSPPRSSP
jgi:membrane associated rhomboid family serine protease